MARFKKVNEIIKEDEIYVNQFILTDVENAKIYKCFSPKELNKIFLLIKKMRKPKDK